MELNGTIFLQIFIFLTLLLWLSRSLFDPILRLFDERERRIVGAKLDAESLSLLADEKAQAFDVEYDRARDSARHALTELKHAMEKEHGESLARVKTMAREKLSKSEAELLQQEQEIRQKLMGASQNLADEIVSALLRKTT